MARGESRKGTRKPAPVTTAREDDAVGAKEKETQSVEDANAETASARDEVDVDRDGDDDAQGTSEDGERKDPMEMMTLRVRITHAWSNVPSMEHLMETHEIPVRA